MYKKYHSEFKLKKRMKKLFILVIATVFTTFAFSQKDPFNKETGKAILNEAYVKGYNIKAGI